jgi:hypothetical protein
LGHFAEMFLWKKAINLIWHQFGMTRPRYKPILDEIELKKVRKKLQEKLLEFSKVQEIQLKQDTVVRLVTNCVEMPIKTSLNFQIISNIPKLGTIHSREHEVLALIYV